MTYHDNDHHGLAVGTMFGWAVALNAAYVLVEALFGFLTGSLALLADAAHNLADVLGLLIAWGAVVLARVKPSERHTYGFGRGTILAALANGVALLIGVGMIVREAIERIGVPQDIPATTVLWVAGIGIAINAGTALLFRKGHTEDINIHGAFLHLAADAAVSGAVVLSAAVTILTGWSIVDPIAAIIVSAVIAWSAFGLFKSAIHLSLDGIPKNINRGAIEAWLHNVPGVTELHDLHVWALSTTATALTVHLVMPAGHPGDAFLDQLADELRDKFGIAHATLQIEIGDVVECRLASANVV